MRSGLENLNLLDVAKFQQLRILKLHGTKVTAAGVAELKKALPNGAIYGPNSRHLNFLKVLEDLLPSIKWHKIGTRVISEK